MAHIKIGTRGSKLALWQAKHAASLLEKRGHTCSIIKIKTKGDKITDVPLARIGGKGLFVKELEIALNQGIIDIAVHSMKDVPTSLENGLKIAAILKREDPRDAFVSQNGIHIEDLPKEAIIGTSSLRRKAQILSNYPEKCFHIKDLRGNLDTRLRKVKEGIYSGIIVAVAGMKRMGVFDEITQIFHPDRLLPAVAQGAIGIEIKCDSRAQNGEFIEDIITPLNHPDSEMLVSAERVFLAKLEGGCQIPIAAHAQKINNNKIKFQGAVWSLDGQNALKECEEISYSNCLEAALSIAEKLLKKGADKILKSIY